MTRAQTLSIDLYHEHLASALVELNAQAFPKDWGERWSDKDLLGALTLPGVTALVARSAEAELVGFLLARQIVDEAEVLLIGVLPRHRSGGIGGALINGFIANTQHGPLKRLFLEVRENNDAARMLYRRLGFKPVGRRDHYYRGLEGQTSSAITLAKSFS